MNKTKSGLAANLAEKDKRTYTNSNEDEGWITPKRNKQLSGNKVPIPDSDYKNF